MDEGTKVFLLIMFFLSVSGMLLIVIKTIHDVVNEFKTYLKNRRKKNKKNEKTHNILRPN
jgi:hypothetical protein